MPNGHDKNWIRVCGAVNGFRSRFQKWPVRIVLPLGTLADLRGLFSANDWETVTGKVELVVGTEMVAEGDNGEQYCFSGEGFPAQTPPCRRTRRPLLHVLAACRLDDYRRRGGKASRNYPRKKRHKQPDSPKIKSATASATATRPTTNTHHNPRLVDGVECHPRAPGLTPCPYEK